MLSFRLASPVGTLEIELDHDIMVRLQFCPQKKVTPLPSHPLAKSIAKELALYFKNPQHGFKLPIEARGTEYQKRVWQALRKIPSGKVLSYQALAQQLSSSPRAIGNACRANPLAIIIPCHRVVAKSGLGGFCGQRQGKMLELKTWLLEHEG